MKNIHRIIWLYYWIILRSYVNTNICSYTDNAESICCQGWVKNVYGDCIKSECFQDCGYGRCVGLNICECFDGITRSDPCPHPKERSCPNNCSNRGKCRDWKCVCDSGYNGLDCNNTIVSTCYVKVNRGLCKSTPDSIKLTKEECCSIFQMAWGNPCQFCNEMNKCGKGYILKNSGCEDIDECQINGICLNGQCINERGSFRCQCPPQYVLNEDTMACHLYKEICELYGSNCGLYGSCVPLITGDYKCICREPYEPSEDGKKCLKRRMYDVCKMFTKLCLPHGDCQPSGLSYYCKCQPGFVQSHDRKSCRINLMSSNTNNEDPCRNPEVSQRCISGQCISDSNNYRCVCYPPYKSSADFQECVLSQVTYSPVNLYCQRAEYYSRCQGGQCIDTQDGYQCKCSSGYISADNGRRCELYDTNGNQGRTPDISSVYCRNKAYYSRCNGGRCIGDNVYGFKCLCLSGYTASQDGRACYPVRTDPCSDNGHKCNPGSCRSLGEDDFQCDCPSQMIRAGDGRSCTLDSHTTTTGSTYCSVPSYRERCATGQCIPDNFYGFKCICASGYAISGDGRACYRIKLSDPCENNGNRCQPGRCRQYGESDYQCDCPEYSIRSADGRSCSANGFSTKATSTYCNNPDFRDRCATGECVPDNYYGFKCLCTADYKATEDGRACHKIGNSESICSKYESNCNGGRCIELGNYGYECQCKDGYRRSSDGRSCIRVEKTRSICDTYGFKCLTGVCYPREDQSYFCLCSDGYSPIDDSKACAKYNSEAICLKYESNCIGGQCIELGNSDYECQCRQGYHRSVDRRSCIKDIQSICDSVAFKCITGVCYSRGDRDYFCLCAEGYSPTEDSKACEKKINKSQCSLYGSRCKGNQCIDKNNDYMCLCKYGYVTSYDHKSCEKTQEEEKCSQYKSRCRDGHCFDIQQGYICVCSSNYVVSEDGRYCTQQEMIILKANDLVDFPLLGSTNEGNCADIFNKDTCNPGKCVNTDQGYTCQCPYSYNLNINERKCERDQKQCPQCYHGCTSTNEDCLCPLGYKNLLQTGLCIKIQNSPKYSMAESHCNAESKSNRTFVIRFNFGLVNDEYLSVEAHQVIVNLIQPKQKRHAKLIFCVPIRKRHNLPKRFQRNISPELHSWRVVCIFDC